MAGQMGKVDCGASPGDASEDAKSRLRRVLGDEGLRRLAASRVAVFGLGGVGSNCAEALVRGGVGRLVFLDRDEVQPSNINRQAIAFVSTVGRRKVDVMAAMAADINPEAVVDTYDMFVRAEDIPDLLDDLGPLDYIVDAIDTVTAKLALAAWAQKRGLPLISAMGGANKTDPTRFAFADLFDTHKCPLCRAMRKQARTQGIEHLQVLYSDEQPVPVAAQAGAERRERTELGTMSYIPPIMGQMLAGFVIRELLAKPSGGVAV